MSGKFLAEFCGSAALLISVVGSSFMAAQLTDDAAIALLINALVTAAVLAVIIKSFQSLSGAHFNPAVTIALICQGKGKWRELPAYLIAQISGAFFGVLIANAMFADSLLVLSQNNRSNYQSWIGELVATAGLVALALFANSELTWKLIPLWIFGAYFFTASTSFANPAVTIARTFTSAPAGIAPQSIFIFITVQTVTAVSIALLVKGKR